MLSRKKLITSGLIYTLGSLLIQGLAFITLPLYTRLLSQEIYGLFNLYNAWVALFSLVVGLQTGGSLSSARIKFGYEGYNDYTRTALSLTNISFGLIFTIVYLFRDFFSQILDLPSFVVVLLLIQSYFSYMTGFLGQYFIQQQKANTTLVISAFSAITNVMLSILLIYHWDDDFLARVVGQLFPSFLITLGTLIYFYCKFDRPLVLRYIPFVLSVSLPLIFHHLGHQLLNQLDRIMLGKMMTVKEVGTYSFGYNVGLVIQIVLGSINTAWVPWFFEAKKTKLKHLDTIVIKYLSLGLFLTLGYLTIFPELANLLGGQRYQDSHDFIGMIIVSYFFVFLYTFPVNIQFYHANTRYIPIGTLLAASFNLILNYWFIPILGVYGSAIATVLSYAALLFFHHSLSRRLYQYKDVSLKSYLLLSFVAICYACVMTLLIEIWLVRWSIGFIVLLVYVYYYRNDIMTFINSQKKVGGKV